MASGRVPKMVMTRIGFICRIGPPPEEIVVAGDLGLGGRAVLPALGLPRGAGAAAVAVVTGRACPPMAPGHAQGQQEEHGLHGAAGGEHHGGQAQDGADDIEHRHRLLLGEAHVDEPVVDVAPVGVHGALPVGQPAENGKAGVEDGQAQHEEGHGEGDDGVELEQALDGHGGQHKAQEGGAGVPHEDLGRVQVIGQKADAGAGQGGHQDGHLGLGHRQGDDQQGHGADGGHAAGQAVQPVDQVDGVGDGHDPDAR